MAPDNVKHERISKCLSNIQERATLMTPCHGIYSNEHKKIETITATEPQPHRTVLEYFAIFDNVAHSLEPGETPSNC